MKFSAVKPCAWQMLEDDVVIVQPRTQKMHVLNAVGALLWKHVQEPSTLDDAVAAVMAEFQVDETTATRDVEAFLSELSELGLIETRE